MLFSINVEESELKIADSIGRDSEIERRTMGEFTRRRVQCWAVHSLCRLEF